MVERNVGQVTAKSFIMRQKAHRESQLAILLQIKYQAGRCPVSKGELYAEEIFKTSLELSTASRQLISKERRDLPRCYAIFLYNKPILPR